MVLACTGMVVAGACMDAQVPEVRRADQVPVLKPAPTTVMGRADVRDGAGEAAFGGRKYVAQWPGVVFETHFKGPEVYFRVGKAHEILHVRVDGKEPVPLADPQPGVYRVSGLGDKVHDVRIEVVTESQDAPNVFGGFAVPKNTPLLKPRPAGRQIEFIGDSHTVGYGNSSAKTTCSTDEVWATTDTSRAFGPLVAAHYGAEDQVNAMSGRGVVRNYNGFAGDTLPEAYPYVLLDHKQVYADATWRPQVLVIALGTNDFSTALHAGERWPTREALHADFEAKYAAFLRSLRTRHPGAYMVVWATEMAQGEIEAEAGKVVDALRAAGETRITFLPVNGLQFSGCHEHPSLRDDVVLRDKLVQAIDAAPDVWQGR